jgi:F-type H+-transporting ATPase subunit gamma
VAANARLIKRRIKSAQNIAKITKAMEMVSASKMRRAQDAVTRSRPYAEKLADSLNEIATHTDPTVHPLLQASESTTGVPLLILVSTDRGLCGGLNTNLFKATLEFIEQKPNTQVLVIGRKGQDFAIRSGLQIIASFVDMPDTIKFQDILPILEIAIPGFLNGTYSEVNIAHMKFISTLSQQVSFTRLLPFSQEFVMDTEIRSEYVFEPSAAEILNRLLPAYLETMMYQVMLDSRASEHSARMITMQNASNNAKDVVSSLNLEYNKSRQASITQELLEINTALLALTN